MILPDCVFLTEYGEIELKIFTYDVISVTSSSFRHQTKDPKIFHFGPLPYYNFWLCQ